MQGGGPEIRGLTKRVFHHHDIKTVEDEIVQWSIEAVRYLGCSPCTLAIGIGRSHLESTALMTEAQIYGRHGVQTPLEKSITQRVNSCNVGPIGIGQGVSVLGTFIRIGPQRASGVRIVSLRPCCYMEPRLASVDIFRVSMNNKIRVLMMTNGFNQGTGGGIAAFCNNYFQAIDKKQFEFDFLTIAKL